MFGRTMQRHDICHRNIRLELIFSSAETQNTPFYIQAFIAVIVDMNNLSKIFRWMKIYF